MYPKTVPIGVKSAATSSLVDTRCRMCRRWWPCLQHIVYTLMQRASESDCSAVQSISGNICILLLFC